MIMKKGLRITLIVIGALFAIIIIAAIFGEPAPATTQKTETILIKPSRLLQTEFNNK